LNVKTIAGQSDPYGDEFFIEVKFQPNVRVPPQPVTDIQCLGCNFSGLKKGDRVPAHEAKLVRVKRNKGEKLSFAISIEGVGETGRFDLPPQPKMLKRTFKNWETEVDANRKTPTRHERRETRCWPGSEHPGLVLGNKEEIVIGSADQKYLRRGGPKGYGNGSIVSQHERQVCYYFYVSSEDPDNGGDYYFGLSVWTVVAVE
jgi:hypothetical protein